MLRTLQKIQCMATFAIIGRFGFDVMMRVFTLLTTSKQEWLRGREGLGVKMGVNKGDGIPGIEMEGIPLLL